MPNTRSCCRSYDRMDAWNRSMRPSAFMLTLLAAMSGCATPLQSQPDAEVKRLCAIDGGVKLYETVKLPPEKFNQWGQIKFYRATQSGDGAGPMAGFSKIGREVARRSRLVRQTWWRRARTVAPIDLPLPKCERSERCCAANKNLRNGQLDRGCYSTQLYPRAKLRVI